MMSQDESEQIILRSMFPPLQIPHVSIGEFIYEVLTGYDENRIILIDNQTEEELTIKELISRAKQVAIALVAHGITKQDVVFFDGLNSIPYAITILAVIFVGNVITTCNPRNNIYEVSNQIRNSQASIVFAAKSLAPIVKAAIHGLKDKQNIKLKVCFDEQFEDFIAYQTLLKDGESADGKLDKIPYFKIDPKADIGTIMYTSGTTGLPKGAMTTHHAHVGALITSKTHGLLDEYGAISLHYPFGHVSGLLFYQMCLVQSIKIVLVDVPTIDKILSVTQKYKVTFLGIFPQMGEALASGVYDKYDLSSVTKMSVGGAQFPGSLIKKLIEKYNLMWFRKGYGMTETLMSIIDIPGHKFMPDDVGRLSPNMELKIVDLETGKSLGPNQDGELCLRGPLMFKGYLNNEEATANTIDSDGWLHTGDVGHYNEDGHLFITDRIKELIKYQHYSIFPTEIEAFLLEHDAISEVVVIGVKHVIDGAWPRAYIKVKEGKEVSAHDIDKYLSENMGERKGMRAGIVFVEQIPRTAIGKCDRQYFKNLVKDEVIS